MPPPEGVELVAEDDVPLGLDREHEVDFARPTQVGQVADLRHQRRDPDAAGDQHDAVGLGPSEREPAGRGAARRAGLPARTVSCRCRDDSPRSSRLIVSSQYPTRVGGEAIVYDRRTFRPSIISVRFRYWPGRKSNGRRGPVADARRNVRTSGVSSNTWATRSCPAQDFDRAGAAMAGRIGTSGRPPQLPVVGDQAIQEEHAKSGGERDRPGDIRLDEHVEVQAPAAAATYASRCRAFQRAGPKRLIMPFVEVAARGTMRTKPTIPTIRYGRLRISEAVSLTLAARSNPKKRRKCRAA